MTENVESKIPQLFSSRMLKSMLTGAAIGLILISFFLISAGEPDPSWGKFWRIKPLLIVPIAGAMGGSFFYYMRNIRFQNEWVRLLAVVFGCLGFLVALWLGSVLGLNGTYWN